jgi:hypothetical protein
MLVSRPLKTRCSDPLSDSHPASGFRLKSCLTSSFYGHGGSACFSLRNAEHATESLVRSADPLINGGSGNENISATSSLLRPSHSTSRRISLSLADSFSREAMSRSCSELRTTWVPALGP